MAVSVAHAMCVGYYCSGILCLFLYKLVPGPFERYSLVAHGKTATIAVKDLPLLVPKRLFSLFYAMGMVWALAILPLARRREWLLLGHLARRLVETLAWPYSATSKMHLLHAVVGLSFYPVLVTSFALSSHVAEIGDLRGILLLSLFLGVSLWQSLVHHVLYKLQLKYPGHCPLVKHSWLFHHILCPHYTAEIIAYLCLTAMTSFHHLPLLASLFVLANLTISAQNTRVWYLRKFPPHPTDQRPAALLPLCL